MSKLLYARVIRPAAEITLILLYVDLHLLPFSSDNVTDEASVRHFSVLRDIKRLEEEDNGPG